MKQPITFQGLPLPQIPVEDIPFLLVALAILLLTVIRVFRPEPVSWSAIRSTLFTDILMFVHVSGFKKHNGDIYFTIDTLFRTSTPSAGLHNEGVINTYCRINLARWQFKVAEWFRRTFFLYLAVLIFCMIFIKNVEYYKWPLLIFASYKVVALFCLWFAEKTKKEIDNFQKISDRIKDRSSSSFQAN